MITKEEALSNKWNPQSSAVDLEDVHLRDAVFYGMQLYAKEVAIEFANFIYLNFRKAGGEGWWDEKNGNYYRTEKELFKSFLQSINQNG